MQGFMGCEGSMGPPERGRRAGPLRPFRASASSTTRWENVQLHGERRRLPFTEPLLFLAYLFEFVCLVGPVYVFLGCEEGCLPR